MEPILINPAAPNANPRPPLIAMQLLCVRPGERTWCLASRQASRQAGRQAGRAGRAARQAGRTGGLLVWAGGGGGRVMNPEDNPDGLSGQQSGQQSRQGSPAILRHAASLSLSLLLSPYLPAMMLL
jgi:hypothetical protein